ncbi:MAG: hypothetical protein IKI09_11520 [Bacteroidales bacterium]|nr:hypothetical protein [Bacteroidales bacterium]
MRTCSIYCPISSLTTTRIAAGGLSGGVSASMAGGEFIDGLCNGLICAGLNHALHWVADGRENLVKTTVLPDLQIRKQQVSAFAM